MEEWVKQMIGTKEYTYHDEKIKSSLEEGMDINK